LLDAKSSRGSRGLIAVRKPDRKPALVDRIGLWLSTGREIDGLWVGTTESKPHPALCRVEEALQLIKCHDSLNYSRVTRYLDRIWLNLIPSARAHYDPSLNACIIDERYLLPETMPIAKIASTIVHEATHARLDKFGVSYVEERRARIEAICLRRELNFLAKLPDSTPLRDEVVSTLDWFAADNDYLSDENFRERKYEGGVETLRYLGDAGVPGWFVRFAIWLVRRQQLRLRHPRNARILPPSRDLH
jgi:hypothetical protein